MRKRTVLIPILILIVILGFIRTITRAGTTESVQQAEQVQKVDPDVLLEQAQTLRDNNKSNEAEKIYNQVIIENPGSSQALQALEQIAHIAISQGDQKKADTTFNQMVKEFSENSALGEAIYKIGTNYQYTVWNPFKANEAHNYNIEHFPDTKYGMLSNVEIIRSYLRYGNSRVDAEVDKWMDKYKDQPDQVMGIYLLARAYAGNNKDEKALPLFQYIIQNYPTHIYGQLSRIRYDTTNKDYDTADKAANNLIASYPDNEDVKENIRYLADYYKDKKEYDRAIHFYKAEIENFTDYDDPVVPYREAIYCCIDMKDIEKADVLIGQMQTNLSENPNLARANFDIGNYFLNEKEDPKNALKMHKYNADNYTDVMEAMWSQAALVSYYVRNNDQTNADIEYAKLMDAYKGQATLPKEIFQIGDIYRNEKNNYEKALSLYKYQLEKWPNYGEPTDSYRRLACTYIDMDDIENADAVIGQMQTKFAKNPMLPRANFDIGNYFLNDANDPGNALKVHNYNADNYTDIMEAMWSQAALVWYYVRHNDQTNADIEYAKLLELYKDQKTLAKEVFQIADIYTEVGNTTKARALHNKVLNEWSESEYIFNARAGLIKADIKEGNDEDAITGIDSLLLDFNDRSSLPLTILEFGKEYYSQANLARINFRKQTGQREKPVLDELSTNKYTKAREIFVKIINKLPDSQYVGESMFMIGEIYCNLEQFQDAIEYYEGFIEKWPDYEYSWVAQDRIIKIYKKAGNYGTGRGLETEKLIIAGYEKLLEEFPDCPMAERAQRQLDYYREINKPKESYENMTPQQMTDYVQELISQGGVQ